jgi:hypothetical protein
LAISLFFMVTASSMCCPLTHSVTTLLLAMADPRRGLAAALFSRSRYVYALVTKHQTPIN